MTNVLLKTKNVLYQVSSDVGEKAPLFFKSSKSLPGIGLKIIKSGHVEIYSFDSIDISSFFSIKKEATSRKEKFYLPTSSPAHRFAIRVFSLLKIALGTKLFIYASLL